MRLSDTPDLRARSPGARRRIAADAGRERRSPARTWLTALRLGEPVDAPAVAVVAHPDDETVGLGARLSLLRNLTLIQVTDGAPADGVDAMRAGFADREGYARARGRELEAALVELAARPRRIGLRLQDQAAALQLAPLARRLRAVLEGAELVITHAYEGGHPDHDACAFAVQSACARMPDPPARLEFAGYHKAAGRRVTGRFWPDPDRSAVQAAITPEQLARKHAAIAAHRTQADVLAWFDPMLEMYREAPAYDFTQPPPPGEALYDDWGLSLSSALWRDHARAALGELAAEGPLWA